MSRPFLLLFTQRDVYKGYCHVNSYWPCELSTEIYVTKNVHWIFRSKISSKYKILLWKACQEYILISCFVAPRISIQEFNISQNEFDLLFVLLCKIKLLRILVRLKDATVIRRSDIRKTGLMFYKKAGLVLSILSIFKCT